MEAVEQNKVKRSPRIRTLIVFSVMIMMTFVVIVTYQASRTYERALQDARENTTKLIHILTDHVELTFLGVDL